MSFNACGDCNACCTRYGIDDMPNIIVKEKDTLCSNYCNGCTIYEDRPKTCSEFKCLWLVQSEHNNGDYPIELRPDHSGAMVVSRPPMNGEGEILIEEIAEGSFDIANLRPEQQKLIDSLVALVNKQSIPVKLLLRTYDWKLYNMNIKMEQKS